MVQTAIQWKHILFVVLLLALAGMIAKPETTGNVVYQDSYYSGYYDSGFFGFYGGEDLIFFYEQYGLFIDFVLFLLIFMGLGRVVFGTHFRGAGGTSIYVGLGIALAFALVYFEYENNFRILTHLGPMALIVFGLLLLVFMFVFMRRFGLNPLFAIAFPVALLAAALKWVFVSAVEQDICYGILQSVGINFCNHLGWIAGIAGFLAFASILFSRRFPIETVPEGGRRGF